MSVALVLDVQELVIVDEWLFLLELGDCKLVLAIVLEFNGERGRLFGRMSLLMVQLDKDSLTSHLHILDRESIFLVNLELLFSKGGEVCPSQTSVELVTKIRREDTLVVKRNLSSNDEQFAIALRREANTPEQEALLEV